MVLIQSFRGIIFREFSRKWAKSAKFNPSKVLFFSFLEVATQWLAEDYVIGVGCRTYHERQYWWRKSVII